MFANCPQCNTPIQSDSVYCDTCGANLAKMMSASTMPYAPPPEGTSECMMCGYANPPRTNICEYCGSPLSRQPAGAAPSAPPDQTLAEPESASETPAEGSSGQAQPDAPPQPAPPVQSEPSPGYFLVQPGGDKITIPVGIKEVIIGRDDIVSNVYPDIDLSSFDALKRGVGRKHIRLTFQEKQAYIEDLNSVNGSHLNGERLKPIQLVPINQGDELVLGRLKLIYQAG